MSERLPVYKREGNIISDVGEFLETSKICYISVERENPKNYKSNYIVVLTTLETEYVTYGKNVKSIITLISKLDGFVQIDRSTVVNLIFDFEYNKDLGHLTYKNINYKRSDNLVIGRKYDKSLEAELRNIGKWPNT